MPQRSTTFFHFFPPPGDLLLKAMQAGTASGLNPEGMPRE
jgi:hypothetical protein